MKRKTVPPSNHRFPKWRKPPLPGLQGFADSVLQRVSLQSHGGEERVYSAFFEEVGRSLSAYETRICGILTSAIQPIQAEYQAALHAAARPLPAPPSACVCDTYSARAVREEEHRRSEAAASIAAAAEKARTLEIQMLALVAQAESMIRQACKTGELTLVSYSKWTRFTSLEAEIPHIPCGFDKSCYLRQIGLSLEEKKEG